MNKTGLSLLAVAAGLLTLLAVPATRWVPLSHLDYLWGLRNRPALAGIERAGPDFDLPLSDVQVSSRNEAIAFGAAYQQTATYNPPAGKWDAHEKVAPLRRFVQDHPEHVAARALLLSMASSGIVSAAMREHPLTQEQKGRAIEVLSEVEFACRNVDRLDPANAYFPSMRAVALYAAGRDGEARAALVAASNKRRYDEYAFAAADARIEALEDRYGYRGRRARLMVLIDYILPQDTIIPKLAEALCVPSDPDIRIATARLAKTIMREAPLAFDIYMGARMAKYAAAAHGRVEPNSISADDQAKMAIERLGDLEASGRDPGRQVRSAYEMANRVSADALTGRTDPIQELVVRPEPMWLATSVIWVAIPMLAIGALLLGRGIERKGGRPYLWANAVWPAAFLMGAPQGGYGAWALGLFAIAQIILILGWRAVADRYWWAVALGGAATVGLLGFADWSGLSGAAGLFLAATFTSRLTIRSNWLAVAAFNILLIAAVFVASGQSGPGLVYSLPVVVAEFVVLLLVAIGLSPKMSDVPRSSYGWAVALLGLMYLGIVGNELLTDRSIGAGLKSIAQDAPDLRARFGIG